VDVSGKRSANKLALVFGDCI